MSRIVVVGRQAPAPSAVQACAEALTGAACTRLPARQWYQRIDAVHELADGRLVGAERDHHPDSIAEAFRRRITVLELQQIIGRGRGLWRTAELSPQREITIESRYSQRSGGSVTIRPEEARIFYFIPAL